MNLFLYTRPGAALYDVHVIMSASSQGSLLVGKLERHAAEKGMTKDALYEQINERWQHNASLFQLGDEFSLPSGWRCSTGADILWSTSSSRCTCCVSLLFGCVTWLYYLHYGFRQNIFLVLFSFTVLLLYLSRALPRMYGTTGWNSLLKSFVLLIGLECSRVFFVTFTMILSLIQTLRH